MDEACDIFLLAGSPELRFAVDAQNQSSLGGDADEQGYRRQDLMARTVGYYQGKHGVGMESRMNLLRCNQSDAIPAGKDSW